MSKRLLRPRYPNLNPGHPWARYCIGAWFFGDGHDFVRDASGNNFHATYAGSIANPFIRSASPYGPATLSDSANSDPRYTLGSINPSHPLSLNQSSAALISARFFWESSSDQWPRIIDKSSGGSAANGWALTYYSPNIEGRLQAYTAGVLRLNTTTTDTLRDGEWNHVVATLRFGAANTAAGNAVYINGVDATLPQGGVMNKPPAVTTDCALLNWNHTASARRFVGTMDHIIVYSIRIDPGVVSAVNWFTRDHVQSVFDDPYEPFRPPSNIELFEPAGVAPPTEFEPHRMFLAGD